MPSWSKSMDSRPTTTGSGFSWRPTIRAKCWEPGELDAQVRSAGIENAKLIEWTSDPSRQPPQSWWDETDDPFTPDDRP
jgi:hypothetical protein